MSIVKLFNPRDLFTAGAFYGFNGAEIIEAPSDFPYPDKRSGNTEIGQQFLVRDEVVHNDEKYDVYMNVACFRDSLPGLNKLKLKAGDRVNVAGKCRKKKAETIDAFISLVVESKGKISRASAV